MQSSEVLNRYPDTTLVSDLYDNDELFRQALNDLIGPDFEYPDFAHLTVAQARKKAAQRAPDFAFQIGDIVCFTNEYGVKWHGRRVTSQIVDPVRGRCYGLEPSDALWFPKGEAFLTAETMSREELLICSEDDGVLKRYLADHPTYLDEIADWLEESTIERALDGLPSIDDLVETALNAACLAIQQKVGQTDGGLAGVMFSGDAFKKLFEPYCEMELLYARERLGNTQPDLGVQLRQAIPDTDGLEAMGFRHGLESMVLALRANGVQPAVIDACVTEALDAYGNNHSDSELTLNLNVFDENGTVVDSFKANMSIPQIEDVVCHAAQLTQIRRSARRSSGDTEGVLAELEEALTAAGIF